MRGACLLREGITDAAKKYFEKPKVFIAQAVKDGVVKTASVLSRNCQTPPVPDLLICDTRQASLEWDFPVLANSEG